MATIFLCRSCALFQLPLESKLVHSLTMSSILLAKLRVVGDLVQLLFALFTLARKSSQVDFSNYKNTVVLKQQAGYFSLPGRATLISLRFTLEGCEIYMDVISTPH